MGLNAVQQFAKAALNGLNSPQLQPLTAVIEPPPSTQVGNKPIAFIWAADGHQQRQSMPRTKPGGTGGYMKWVWKVDVGITVLMHVADDTVDSAFPLLLDQIVALMNLIPLTQFIMDPDTAVQSQLLAIGEVIDLSYARVRTTGPTGAQAVKFAGSMTLEVQEAQSYNAPSFYNPVGSSDDSDMARFTRDRLQELGSDLGDPSGRRYVPVSREVAEVIEVAEVTEAGTS